MLDHRRGVWQVEHDGATAGYLAHLARYPDQRVSVAVLCNVGSAAATQRAYDVADLYLAERITLAPPPALTYTLKADELSKLEGVYRSVQNGRFVKLVWQSGGLRIDGGAALLAKSAARFVTAAGQTWEFEGSRARARNRYDTVDYERVPEVRPAAAELSEFVGTYVGQETETTMRVAIEGEALVLMRRPATKLSMIPVYQDAFNIPPLGLAIFRRDAAARVVALSVVQDRVWDLRFSRQSVSAPSTSR
jgi:hypothetical protein